MSNIRDELSRAQLFERLSSDQLDTLAQNAVNISLPEGQLLFEQNDKADRFFHVLSGQIKLFRLSHEGNEKVIEIVTPGQTFAIALLFMNQPLFPVCGSALSDAKLISIDSHTFASILRNSIDTCFLLLGDMSQRIRGLIKEIDDLSLQSGTCRVAAYILKNKPQDTNTFSLEIPKGVMASRLSVKPETFSRIIKRLQLDGILSVDRNQVTIQDINSLMAIAEYCDQGVESPDHDYIFSAN
jgi:CRP-like cAMP-binding protein